jgi:RhtB (resistance to homoserine/threonine) family protein
MHVWAFIAVAIVLIVVPGPDMALVTRNALLFGRGPALATSLGVCTGLLVWTVASAFGVAAIIHASAVAFTVLKLVGGAYLLWLGVQALRTAGRHAELPPRRPVDGTRGFRQGLMSNLANPKIAVLFTSLLPQFVDHGERLLVPFLTLGTIFVVLTLIWLSGYAVAASRASGVLQRPRVRRALDRLTGVVLIALGVRLATERR